MHLILKKLKPFCALVKIILRATVLQVLTETLPEGLSDTEYARAFLSEFGADIGKPVVYTDVVGEPLVIDEGLFLNKKTMKFKANKLGRGIYMRLLAKALKDPDEIWIHWENERTTGKPVLKRRYIKIYETKDGSHCLTVFDKDEDKWTGQTTFSPRAEDTQTGRDKYIQKYRDGFLTYKKKSQSVGAGSSYRVWRLAYPPSTVLFTFSMILKNQYRNGFLAYKKRQAKLQPALKCIDWDGCYIALQYIPHIYHYGIEKEKNQARRF